MSDSPSGNRSYLRVARGADEKLKRSAYRHWPTPPAGIDEKTTAAHSGALSRARSSIASSLEK
eukprot:7382201-Prymnesium_polylepis.3